MMTNRNALKPDGKLTHCSHAIAAQNIPEYAGIFQKSKEALLDLRGLTEIDVREVFLPWSRNYPTRGGEVPRSNGQLGPASRSSPDLNALPQRGLRPILLRYNDRFVNSNNGR